MVCVVLCIGRPAVRKILQNRLDAESGAWPIDTVPATILFFLSKLRPASVARSDILKFERGNSSASNLLASAELIQLHC
jgi:hypothetical protein